MTAATALVALDLVDTDEPHRTRDALCARRQLLWRCEELQQLEDKVEALRGELRAVKKRRTDPGL